MASNESEINKIYINLLKLGNKKDNVKCKLSYKKVVSIIAVVINGFIWRTFI